MVEDDEPRFVECPYCDGGEEPDGERCSVCDGRGEIEEELQPMTLDDLEERDAEEGGSPFAEPEREGR